jgi:hypothetical protein
MTRTRRASSKPSISGLGIRRDTDRPFGFENKLQSLVNERGVINQNDANERGRHNTEVCILVVKQFLVKPVIHANKKSLD